MMFENKKGNKVGRREEKEETNERKMLNFFHDVALLKI